MKAVKVLTVALMLLAMSSAGVFADAPTEVPTEVPTYAPTTAPTDIPTEVPTVMPTELPTEVPTVVPTELPTEIPTEVPTVIPGLAAPLLTASHSGTNTTLQWPTDGATTSYTIYEADGAAGKFAVFPSGWTLIDTIAPAGGTTSYNVADGADNTYNTYSCFVVTSTDGTNVSAASNIATRIDFYFQLTGGSKNNYRPSLPYMSKYAYAIDIVNELTYAKIDRVAKFGPVNQSYVAYQSFGGPWTGPNWANDAGTSASNAFLLHPTSTFNWIVAGTDNNPDLSFTANVAKASSNVRQMPYSGIYTNAASIVTDIEGGTGAGSNTKIFRIALWNPVNQSYLSYQNLTGLMWTGPNFAVAPGAIINFYVSPGVTFTWTPKTVVK